MLSSIECIRKYGAPEDENFMVLWDVPTELEIGVIPKKIYCNKDMIEPLSEAFRNLILRKHISELKTWDGCYSGDTEYFTGTGWKRIDEYTDGLVGQVDEKYVLSLTEPSAYIVDNCDRFIHVKSGQGVEQMLSEDHRMIYFDKNGREYVDRAHSVYERYLKTPHTHIGIPTTFTACCEGVDYPLDYVRLKVAVFADGCFPHKTRDSNSNYCHMYFSKERKILRLRDILKRLQMPYKETVNARGDTSFYFYMDNNDKTFTEMWYGASSEQLEAICDEVLHWDASVDNRLFFSTDKASADFIQYARSATGIRAKVMVSRKGAGVHRTCFSVSSAKSPRPCVAAGGSGMAIVETPGAKKYCFSVPTGRLLMRYNGHVFISGNCFNIRPQRGAKTSSLHSWGVAVDVNAAWNPFVVGKKPTLSEGFVKCFTDAGFDWGGTWKRPDGMHFQLRKI